MRPVKRLKRMCVFESGEIRRWRLVGPEQVVEGQLGEVFAAERCTGHCWRCMCPPWRTFYVTVVGLCSPVSGEVYRILSDVVQMTLLPLCRV